jgi:hypothetical protein
MLDAVREASLRHECTRWIEVHSFRRSAEHPHSRPDQFVEKVLVKS